MILPFPSGKVAAPPPTLRRIATRKQRTLAKTAFLHGTGFITGAAVQLRLQPAPAGSGLCFVRVDLPGSPSIPAVADRVSGTARRTTLGESAAGVTLVEHLLAALAGLKIDNCRIELDGPEPPGLDGSAMAFVEAIQSAGIQTQAASRDIWCVTRPVIVEHSGASLSIFPGESRQLEIGYRLDYGIGSAIPSQSFTSVITPQTFENELAASRTFVLEDEAKALQAQGVGRHLKPSELLVFGRQGVLDNRLRFANEPARHKVLDLVGDLALCGLDIIGQIVAYRSGHPLNVQLANRLLDMHEEALAKETRRAA